MTETPFSSQQIYLDSDDADIYINSKISDCIWTFNDIIVVPPNIEMLLSVVNVTIPISWYIVDSTRNTIVWSLNGVDQSDIVIPEGNYTATQLQEELDTQFSGTITTTYSETQSKYTFSHDSQDFVFKSTSTCLEILGFSSANHSSANNQLTSNQIVDLAGVKTVQLRSNFTTNSLETKTKGFSTILARIPVPLAQGSILVYTNKTGFKSKLTNRHINYIRLTLEDHDNKALELNNIEWSCTLQIDYQKQRRYTPPQVARPVKALDKEEILRQVIEEQLGLTNKE